MSLEESKVMMIDICCSGLDRCSAIRVEISSMYIDAINLLGGKYGSGNMSYMARRPSCECLERDLIQGTTLGQRRRQPRY